MAAGAAGDLETKSLQVGLGNAKLAGRKLAGEQIDPGQSAVVLLADHNFIVHVGREKLDRLVIRAHVRGQTDSSILTHEVPLEQPTTAAYTFPLKGTFLLANGAQSYEHHRMAYSQEFALDIVATQERSGELSTSKPAPDSLDDYYIYGSPVLAAADGTVRALGESFPEAMTVPPWDFSDEKFVDVARSLVGKADFVNLLAGNYVVVEHNDREFSLYAHLQGGSVQVKIGDSVRRGDVLARVGSTGNSTEPHLHFQLMDAPDFLVANGLPIRFQNTDFDFRAANTFFDDGRARVSTTSAK